MGGGKVRNYQTKSRHKPSRQLQILQLYVGCLGVQMFLPIQLCCLHHTPFLLAVYSLDAGTNGGYPMLLIFSTTCGLPILPRFQSHSFIPQPLRVSLQGLPCSMLSVIHISMKLQKSVSWSLLSYILATYMTLPSLPTSLVLIRSL